MKKKEVEAIGGKKKDGKSPKSKKSNDKNRNKKNDDWMPQADVGGAQLLVSDLW